MHLTQQCTTIYLQLATSYNELKALCLGQSGVHFIATVTTVTIIIRSAGVRFISFVACEAIIIRYYTILLKIVVVAMLVVVRVVVVAFLRYIQDSAPSAPLFAGFICSSGNDCPLKHKGTNSPSVFLIHPEVQGSVCVSQRSVQCLYW